MYIFNWSISNYRKCAERINKVEERLKPMDIFVNNAVIKRDGMFHKMSKEEWQGVIKVNLFGFVNMSYPVFEPED